MSPWLDLIPPVVEAIRVFWGDRESPLQ